MGYSEARGDIIDVLIHVPDQTNMSLTLGVNQQAEDSQTCRRAAIQTGLRAAQGGHNSSTFFTLLDFRGIFSERAYLLSG